MSGWTASESAHLYGVNAWGSGFLAVDASGDLCVELNGHKVSINDIIEEAQKSGLRLPLLLRFPEIIRDQVNRLAGAFHGAIADLNYSGTYRGVFPIKVNQERCVVEDVVSCAANHHMGLEAGSKPELLIVLATLNDPDALIVCNGYKDTEYIETALWAQRIGRRPFLVVEKPSELTEILDVSARLGIRPHIGIRARLSSQGTGRWQSSSGDRAKFGLDSAQIISAIEELGTAEMLDCLELLHFHIGSQVSAIRPIKDAVQEATRIYVELVKMGAPMGYLDVGGGLGVDYDGTRTNLPDSISYTVEEYAADIVSEVRRVVDEQSIAHPTLITEAGRAMVAHHAILVAEVVGVDRVGVAGDAGMVAEDDPEPLKALAKLIDKLESSSLQTVWQETLSARATITRLFTAGRIDLRQRALAEELFWRVAAEVDTLMDDSETNPDDLSQVRALLSDTYTTNFSIFQSMPDAWAIDQRFPVMPIHRLNEEPSRRGMIADLTCDSDGKLNRFISGQGSLPLHELDGKPYRLGFFLLGAYQEILGDLHNLFGDTHAVHVQLNGQRFIIDDTEEGDTVYEVLKYVHFDADKLIHKIAIAADIAIEQGDLDDSGKEQLIRFYEHALSGYTYFE